MNADNRLGMEEVACIMKILADKTPDPKSLDAIYLFHQTIHNSLSSIRAARKLFYNLKDDRNGRPVPIAIAGWKTSVCGPGYETWQEHLGIEPVIVVPPVDHVNTNSLTESKALAKYSRKRRWRNIIIIAPPFHLPRAFITLISVLPSLRIYNHPGQALGWNTQSIHSQGVQKGTWMEFAKEELAKIRLYQQKGDLVKFPAVIDYLNRRDA